MGCVFQQSKVLVVLREPDSEVESIFFKHVLDHGLWESP
jgi:hypothetical protein